MKINTIELNVSTYNLRYRKEDTYIDFNVQKMDPQLPDIGVYESLEDPKLFEVMVSTTSVGELNTVDLEFHIERMMTALEAAKEIKEILVQDFDLEVI